MKRALCVILALYLGLCACAMADEIAMPGVQTQLVLLGDPEKDEGLQLVLGFIASNAADAKARLVAEGRYAPLRAYKLTWPVYESAIDETVAKAYGGYRRIYAIQFEIETHSAPFTYCKYVAVGVGENGDMEFCASPDELIARNYDPMSFKDFRVTLYKFGGIDRSAIVIYLPDADYNGLESNEAEGQNSAVGLIYALEKAKAVPQGTHVLGFDGETLDLSPEFGQAMANTGTTGEYLMMGAVVNTFLTNFSLKQIMVTSEGKVIETGHSVYDEPLEFYK